MAVDFLARRGARASAGMVFACHASVCGKPWFIWYSNYQMTRNHFLNGLICQIHKHGASCAVDTLFEIFYYAMYDRELKCSLFANSNVLAKALLKGCEVRRIAGSECWVRENVWNVLANVIPYAYAPKGRPDAEILQGFMLLTQNTRNKFASSYTGQFRCSACHKQGTITTVTSSPILEYDQTVNQAFPSNLCQGLAHLIDRDIHQQLASTMQCDCGHFLLPIRGQYDMSEYLLVSLGLAGKYSRNEQKPPVNVSQFVNINQCAYELAGAVQMGSHGGHFMSIVLLPDGSYSVIDDLKNEVLNYPTFAAAVSRNSDTSLNKILQASDPGIHILLFRKIRPVKQVSGIPTAVGINSSGPPRSSGPSSICSVETSMSVPASTYPQVTSGPDGLGAPAAVSINRSGPPRSSGPSSICPMETSMSVPTSTYTQVTSGPDGLGPPAAVSINRSGPPRSSGPSSICPMETSMSVPTSTYPQVTSGPDGLGAPAAVSINRSGPPRSSGPSSICPMETSMSVPTSTYPQVTSGPDGLGAPAAVSINRSGPPRSSGPSSICPMETRMSVPTSTYPQVTSGPDGLGAPAAGGINSSGPPRSSGPSSICPMETSMSVPASTCPQVTSGPDGLCAPAAGGINSSGPPRSSGPSSICPMETNMAVPASTCPQVTSGPDEPGVPTAVGINSTGLPRFSRPSSICLTGPRIALSATTPPHSGIHNSGLLRSSRPSCILLEDASTAEPASSRSLSPSGSSPISPLVDMVAQIPCSSTPNHSPFELSAVPEVVSPISASSVLHPKTVVSPVGMSPSLNISKQSPDVVSESRSSSNKVKLEDISLKIETVAEMQFLSVCGSRVRYFTYDEIRYYSCKDIFVILGTQSQISNRGYGKVISTFGDISGNPFVTTPDRAHWLNEKHLFKVLLDTKAYPKSNKKKAAVYDELSSIKKKTMTKNNLCRKLAEHFDSLAHDFSGNSQFRPLSAASSPTPLSAASSPTPLSTANSPTPLSTSNSPIPCSIANSPSDFSATNSPNPLSTSIQNSPSYFGHVDFFDSVIPYIVIDESLFLSSSHVFKFLELEKHINKEGYRCIYRELNAAGYIDPSVCFYPPDGRVKTHISIIPLLNILLNLSVGANEKKTLLHRELLKILQKIAVKQVNESTCDPDVAKFENLKNIDLATLIANKYSLEKDKFITDLSKLIGKSTFETNFALSEQDLIRLLMSRPTQQRLKIVQAAVQSCYRQLFPVSPKQTVYVADNFKGYKLLTELRRLLPGILPSEQEERAARKAYEMSFSACLQPSRISTGFQVDPSQLMSILKFRYPYIHDKLMVRLTGDGREYGGRHSTFLALSVLNNELLENNVLHQSSKECFPIALFYESDSRDNLEQNLTKPTNVISKFLQTYPSDDASFYFCSDEMFALACLDGSGELSPKSDSAWNIYGTNNADQKQKVSPEGFRTDLPPIFDRTHPECLFPEIPMVNWVFCVLHGGTRVVEKLLNLELETIGSEKHKIHLTKCGLDGTDVLHNLEANINLRGVRSGNFKIHINPNSGKPDPVSLNKNAAFDIISPPPPGMEEKFPHPLHNIIGVRIVKIPLRDSVRKFLELPKEMPELQLVMSIWESFHYMFKTLKSEPEPSNFTGCLSDSSQCQFSWGYSPEQKRLYKFHAERFYQLYCLRYTHRHLTPYMMKFIDYAPYFIENLPVPLNRFQTEGSEHMNYDHNCFYYNHTTRHGGKNKVEPLKALFLHMWRRLCHDIEFQCQDQEVVEAFQLYVKQQVAAVTIGKYVRGWLVRCQMQRRGLKTAPKDKVERIHNYAIIGQFISEGSIVTPQSPAPLFSGMTFILCGSVPKFKNKRCTQSDVCRMIKDNGGRVRKKVPGSLKGQSTKRYFILYEKTSKKVPQDVKSAIKHNYLVMKYQFLYDSVENLSRMPCEDYVVPLPEVSPFITKHRPVQKKHFERFRTMSSLIKKSRKRKYKLTKPPIEKSLPILLYIMHYNGARSLCPIKK